MPVCVFSVWNKSFLQSTRAVFLIDISSYVFKYCGKQQGSTSQPPKNYYVEISAN